jgi:hypothetical protein
MRILLAGILGGIVMFVWTSIAHMALPLGEAGINEIPNESVVLSAMQSSIGDKHENLSRQSPLTRQGVHRLRANRNRLENYRTPVPTAMSMCTV